MFFGVGHPLIQEQGIPNSCFLLSCTPVKKKQKKKERKEKKSLSKWTGLGKNNKSDKTELWFKPELEEVAPPGAGFFLACKDFGRMFYHSFLAFFFFFFQCGDQLAHTNSTLCARISLQWLST